MKSAGRRTSAKAGAAHRTNAAKRSRFMIRTPELGIGVMVQFVGDRVSYFGCSVSTGQRQIFSVASLSKAGAFRSLLKRRVGWLALPEHQRVPMLSGVVVHKSRSNKGRILIVVKVLLVVRQFRRMRPRLAKDRGIRGSVGDSPLDTLKFEIFSGVEFHKRLGAHDLRIWPALKASRT